MNEALFNLRFDAVGYTSSKKMLISRGKKKQKKKKTKETKQVNNIYSIKPKIT